MRSAAGHSRLGAGTVRASLTPAHRSLLRSSGISDEVIDERGYETLMRTNTDNRPRERLRRAGFAVGAYEDDRRFPGLFIPLYGPTDNRVSALYRPDRPRRVDGRERKYEAVRGRPSVLDVHPRNVAGLIDPHRTLWITEGVKKGDALTTAGQCVISLSGVFNWRSRLGTLGDWEDVQLRGRAVVVCFDSDARTNRSVARAMGRLGAWLRSRGARVRFVVTPELRGLGKTGVDDYLVRGGSVQELLEAATAHPPDPDAGNDDLTDSRLAERVTDEVLADAFRYVRGLGWLEYDGVVWRDVGEEAVMEEVRRYFKRMLTEALAASADRRRLEALVGVQSAARIAAVTRLTKGMDGVAARVDEFDADPWLLNAANGVVDLRTGELLEHNAAFLIRHFTPVRYRPGAGHRDWEHALGALPDFSTRRYVQSFLGSGTTGLAPREDIATFWHGAGNNGKSTILGACQAALGDYAKALLPSMLGGRRDEHPTEYMDLLGVRLAFVEETGEGHRLDTVKLKKYLGTEVITGRRMRQDPVSFRATHTLVITTNYRPVVSDTDHGTWRRLRMIPFLKTYGRDGRAIDYGLRQRLMHLPDRQEVVLAWLVTGARRWFDNDCRLPPEPDAVRQATQEWRESTDIIYAFASERLRAAPGRHVEVETLREEFNLWLPAPHQPWGRQTFAERFERHEAIQALGACRGKHPRTRRACLMGLQVTDD